MAGASLVQLYTAMVYQVPSEYHSLMEWRAVLPSTLLDGVQETASSTRRGGAEAWMVEDVTGCSRAPGNRVWGHCHGDRHMIKG